MGFDDYLRFYPATPWQAAADAPDLSDAFLRQWHLASDTAARTDIAVVLTPGLFAEWLPGCFRAARDRFTRGGHRVLRTRVKSGRSVFEQADILSKELTQWLRDGESFIWCGHSKGGLELHRALHINEALRARCVGAVTVQPPVGLSHVLAHFSSNRATLSQRLTLQILGTPLLASGVHEISRERDPGLTRWLETFCPGVPAINVVSWSVEPTSWVDSWHRTLSEVRPGIAHDGQFLMHEQRLPATPTIALPRIDHAQPVLGGNGFDAGRFWQTLVQMATNNEVLFN